MMPRPPVCGCAGRMESGLYGTRRAGMSRARGAGFAGAACGAGLVDLLGLPKTMLSDLKLLREQWCGEPSMHGGQDTRPGCPGQ